jgi:hypothetical protein
MAQDLGFDILRTDQPLPQSVLLCRRMKRTAVSIGYCCAITSRPEARELQELAGIRSPECGLAPCGKVSSDNGTWLVNWASARHGFAE